MIPNRPIYIPGMAVGKSAAVGVDGYAALGADAPAADEAPPSPFGQTQILQEQDRVDGEGVVVQLPRIDVGRSELLAIV